MMAAELVPGFRPTVLRELIRKAKRLGFDSREMYETRRANAAKLRGVDAPGYEELMNSIGGCD
jgi:hypothetical protein